ncbi:hypothetical protein GCM10011414_08170 [Croceivirga lutea]|uniref:response regulator n=1 Tax=Croceivirga lutea TaxID=1775167 RepID=UPI00163B3C1B|nr:response regulator [Croceivirga lutea]GGG41037.1 hypothetical protein GCM10011414_08170 [Croceivirga lutea]
MSKTICIIEDDLVSQFASRYSINQYSNQTYEVIVCNNAEEALELFTDYLEEEYPIPDIILLDLVMGDMDGWEFLDHLEVLLKNRPKPKIYILSAFSKIKDREQAKAHPLIEGYFDKPLTRSSLAKIL